MKFKELINEISTQTGISRVKVKEVMDAFKDTVRDALLNGESVPINALFTLDTVMTAERNYRNIHTGELIRGMAHPRPRCRFSASLKRDITERG